MSRKKSGGSRNHAGGSSIRADESPRLSEPVPHSKLIPTPPQDAGAGVSPRTPAPAHQRTPGRLCRKCRTESPRYEFLLADDPRAAAWATRLWCGTCLVTGGHVSPAQLDHARRAHDDRLAAVHELRVAHERHLRRVQAAGDYRARSEQVAVDLFDAAAADPAFASGLRLAASALDADRDALLAVVAS